MANQAAIPGIIRPTEGFKSTDRKNQPKSIEEKRETAIRFIERYRRGEKGVPKLESYDQEQGGPVIRVLYGSMPLPIFDGMPAAIIDPKTDRDAMWDAIIAGFRSGAYDDALERVSREMVESLNAARAKKAAGANGTPDTAGLRIRRL